MTLPAPDAPQHEVVRRRSGAFANSEFGTVTGLQRITGVLHCARDKRRYFTTNLNPITTITRPITCAILGMMPSAR